MVAGLFLEVVAEVIMMQQVAKNGLVNTKNYGYLQIRINNTDGKLLGTNFYGLYGRPIH
jgi:hypothetical protein